MSAARALPGGRTTAAAHPPPFSSFPLPFFLPPLLQIRQRRPVALPNVGFRLALARHEVQVAGATSVAGQRHDPLWNFAAWRAEEGSYPQRSEAADGGAAAAHAADATAASDSGARGCCTIV